MMVINTKRWEEAGAHGRMATHPSPCIWQLCAWDHIRPGTSGCQLVSDVWRMMAGLLRSHLPPKKSGKQSCFKIKIYYFPKTCQSLWLTRQPVCWKRLLGHRIKIHIDLMDLYRQQNKYRSEVETSVESRRAPSAYSPSPVQVLHSQKTT